jgi:hypothetical protein
MTDTSNLSPAAKTVLSAFNRVCDQYQDASLATLRTECAKQQVITSFELVIRELRVAGLFILSSADRYVTADILAAGIREHGETLTHAHRCQ